MHYYVITLIWNLTLPEIDKDQYAQRYYIGVNHVIVFRKTRSITYSSIYFNKSKEAEFFDSFGLSAEQYKFDKYLKYFSRSYVDNKFQIQNLDSNTCGYLWLYCLYFIMLKSSGFTLNEINSLNKF